MYHPTEVLYPMERYRGVRVCHLFDRETGAPLCGLRSDPALWARRNARIVDDVPTCPHCMGAALRPKELAQEAF